MSDLRRAELLACMRGPRYAVQASVSPAGQPQAAIVGIVVSDQLEILFDTLGATRKMANLRQNPRIALTIGSLQEGDGRGVQLEGLADEPRGAELERLRTLYLEKFPDGRERMSWPGITWVRVKPAWLRYCDYGCTPPRIVELGAAELAGLG